MTTIYNQEFWTSEGTCIKKYRNMIPLYINKEILDAELLEYLHGHPTHKVTPQVLNDEGKVVDGECVSYGTEKFAQVFSFICAPPYSMEKINILADKIGNMTMTDKFELLADTLLGRQILSQYVHPSLITEPIMVTNYYVMPLGLMTPNLLI